MEKSVRRAWHAVRAQLAGIDPRAAAILISATAIIVLARGDGTLAGYGPTLSKLFADRPWRAVVPDLYWFGSATLTFLLLPYLVLRLGLRLSPAEMGLGPGDWRLGLKIAGLLYALMLPVVAVASQLPGFASHYPLCPYVGQQAAALLRGEPALAWAVAAHELGYVLYFVAWEFLFRGFLTVALARYIGPLAVLVQTIPFAILHLGKPQAEVYGSIAAGVALGLLALRCRSIWWGLLLHVAVALTMDLGAIVARLRGIV
ncbi:MAG: CPBP family intramembrane metalloprotease [Deltaproteobacteria bacterium]|nr:CPBP family intramembrane metalloprotease [Deltaproteobacteria bacterium]